ncbi:MAG: dihydrodipicolinate synthase family protein [Planctomycetaceae bacterium]
MMRFPPGILCTCVVPWDENNEFLESLFRHQVETQLKLTPHLYVFGTAGEGHAVSDRQFEQIVRAFHTAMKAGGAEAMVGVISLSLATILERIDFCRKLGVRLFQISLPSWGALTDAEVGAFFQEVCGRFRDCQFLHYNLLRTKRLITPQHYAEMAAVHPNLVATKNSTDSLDRIQGLLEQAPQLTHFLTETGYLMGSQLGECGLLASVATNHAACRSYFEAGRQQDLAKLWEMQGEISRLISALIAAAGPGCHIDSAFDKMLWRLTDERFPLRLLPPYQGASDAGFREFAEAVRTQTPRWSPRAS